MINLRRSLQLFSLLVPLSSLADGMITVSGRLTSNTDKECAIETDTRIYHFQKKNLSSEQLAGIKSGQKKVTLVVPFSGIERVESKAK